MFARMVSLAAVWFLEDVGECVCLEGSAVVATRQVRYVVCEAMQPFPVLCMVGVLAPVGNGDVVHCWCVHGVTVCVLVFSSCS